MFIPVNIRKKVLNAFLEVILNNFWAVTIMWMVKQVRFDLLDITAAVVHLKREKEL